MRCRGRLGLWALPPTVEQDVVDNSIVPTRRIGVTRTFARIPANSSHSNRCEAAEARDNRESKAGAQFRESLHTVTRRGVDGGEFRRQEARARSGQRPAVGISRESQREDDQDRRVRRDHCKCFSARKLEHCLRAHAYLRTRTCRSFVSSSSCRRPELEGPLVPPRGARDRTGALR